MSTTPSSLPIIEGSQARAISIEAGEKSKKILASLPRYERI